MLDDVPPAAEAGTGVETGTAASPGDDADAALAALIDELAMCVDSLRSALERAEELRAHRAQGLTWSAVVADESRPLVVERISAALGALNTAGGRFRRDEARALHADGLSINRIATLFGVTRQRASVLVRATAPDAPAQRAHRSHPADADGPLARSPV